MEFNYLKELISETPVSVLSTFVVLILGIIYFFLRNRNLPPGPTGLPYLGYWPFLENETIHLQLTEMKKKYGEIFSLTVTGRLFIHLGTIKSIKEAHITKANCFSERSQDFSILTLFLDQGVVVANGEEWKDLRKFFVAAFREYGLSSVKDYMAGPIYDSVNAIVENLKNIKGSSCNIIEILNVRSTGILRRMLFNDDQITDEELKSLTDAFQNVMKIFTNRNFLLMGEFARYFMFPRLKDYKVFVENHKKMEDCLMKIVRRHSEAYSEDNVKDIIDSYIRERNKRREKGDPSAKHFTDKALVSSMIQFVGDGILSISVLTAYFINALLDHPEEQEKIYKELEDVIGADRHVTLDDRNKLPYTNAFIQEVLRLTDFMTIFPGLICTKETTMNGYRIPKGAITLMNIWSAHRDPAAFEDPDKFNPSRYLSGPGKTKAETSVIFGVGRRSCAGEAFTMMQVFLNLTAIVRNFKLKRPEGYDKKVFHDGIMEVCVIPRK